MLIGCGSAREVLIWNTVGSLDCPQEADPAEADCGPARLPTPGKKNSLECVKTKALMGVLKGGSEGTRAQGSTTREPFCPCLEKDRLRMCDATSCARKVRPKMSSW